MSNLASLILAAWLGLTMVCYAALAESALVLPRPGSFGDIQADTYDLEGRRLGDASMRIERLPDGNIQLEARSGIEGSAASVISAVLAPLQKGDGVRLLSERSQSVDVDGNDLGVMSIDHVTGTARCAPPDERKAQTIPLPAEDRVVNVPLNLLFQPLATGERREVEFQILVCRSGARFVKAVASVSEPSEAAKGGVIEVRYDLDVGPVLSRLIAPFMPKLSVWFDAQSNGDWIGHRIPLFAKGPTVLVVRSGFAPSILGSGR